VITWLKMHAETLYEETLFLWVFTAILSIVTAGFLGVVVYQVLIGPLGEHPAPNWFLLFLFVLFLAITLTFSRLRIIITSRAITVGYGIFKRTIPWNTIERCYVDETLTIRYGGWGIRIGYVQGTWRLVYNVIGGPRVVLALKRGMFREFVFSTSNPEAVMTVIRQRISERH
jgi:hypothetical protein